MASVRDYLAAAGLVVAHPAAETRKERLDLLLAALDLVRGAGASSEFAPGGAGKILSEAARKLEGSEACKD